MEAVPAGTLRQDASSKRSHRDSSRAGREVTGSGSNHRLRAL